MKRRDIVSFVENAWGNVQAATQREDGSWDVCIKYDGVVSLYNVRNDKDLNDAMNEIEKQVNNYA